MTNHIFLPCVELQELELTQVHQEWLLKWLSVIESEIEDGNVSASLCLQGILSELVVYQTLQTDWLGIIEEYLIDEHQMPIAYSEQYGKRLFRFNFWSQSPIHAIHCMWFVERICLSASKEKIQKYAEFITTSIQPNGWIYNPDVSPTRQRNRMKSEYLMSMAMGCEILASIGRLSDYTQRFQTTLSSLPVTDFLSAEYFRLKALNLLQSPELAPAGLDDLLSDCKTVRGFSEFAIESKVDDYMGTAKRISRDKPMPSPLAGLYANTIAIFCSNDVKTDVRNWLKTYGEHLQKKPFDIQAFRIRDVDISFGTDLSPLEIIAAAFLIANTD